MTANATRATSGLPRGGSSPTTRRRRDEIRSRMHHIDYGLSVLRRGVVASIPAGPPADLAEVLSRLATRGELAAFEAANRFFEIGTEASLAELDSVLGARDRRARDASARSPGRPRGDAARARRRRRRARARVDRGPCAQRGGHDRRVRPLVPRGPARGRRRRRDPDRRQLDRPHPELALAGGARVLRTPKRGLGRAYIDAIPYHPRPVRRSWATPTAPTTSAQLAAVRRAVPRRATSS